MSSIIFHLQFQNFLILYFSCFATIESGPFPFLFQNEFSPFRKRIGKKKKKDISLTDFVDFRTLPTASLRELPALSLLWLEGNPLPKQFATNVGQMQASGPDPDAVAQLLTEYDAFMLHKTKKADRSNSFSFLSLFYYSRERGRVRIVHFLFSFKKN